jgi:hypothetical protein
MPADRPRTRVSSSPSLFPARDPDILDVQATAQMLGISTHAVYACSGKASSPAERWRAAG